MPAGSKLPGWEDDALAHELYVVPRGARVRVPGMEIIERPGWSQLITPSFRDGGLNEVAYSALDEEEADAVIDATIADYRRRGLCFRWSVLPGSRPADLARRLARRGLERSETVAVARSCAPLVDATPDPGIRVALADASTIDAYSAVMAAGWGVPAGPFADYHRRALSASERHLFHLATHDDQVIGGAAAVLFERSVFLIGAVVLPSARGRGAYRALVDARLAAAAAQGIDLATSYAMAATSAPILQRLGFTAIDRFPMFLGGPQTGTQTGPEGIAAAADVPT